MGTQKKKKKKTFLNLFSKRHDNVPLPVLPRAKAEPIVAAREPAVDLLHQRRLRHGRRQAPNRDLRPVRRILHVLDSRKPSNSTEN